MKEIDDLEVEVSENTRIDQSAITLLEGLAKQIEAMKADPARLQALANNLRSSSAALAAAIAANTPAEGGGTTGDTGGGTGGETGGGTGGETGGETGGTTGDTGGESGETNSNPLLRR